jgi:uncharacterized protein (DUF736 family)
MNIGSLWLKETELGKKYFQGNIQSPFLPEGQMNIAIFKNENKATESSPDYSIVWSPRKKEKIEAGSNTEKKDSPFSDENIPF